MYIPILNTDPSPTIIPSTTSDIAPKNTLSSIIVGCACAGSSTPPTPLPADISQFFPISVDINNENISIHNIKICYENYSIGKPYYTENNGCSNLLYPSIARLRNYTYSLSIYVDLIIIISIVDNGSIVILPNKVIKNILLGKIPIMIKSKYCNYKNDKLFCPYDVGGYLIINGNEKVIISQEKICAIKIQVFKNSKFSKTL